MEVVDTGVLEPAADTNDVLDGIATPQPGQELARRLLDADLEAEAEVVADLDADRADTSSAKRARFSSEPP